MRYRKQDEYAPHRPEALRSHRTQGSRMSQHQTQGRRLIALLKRRACTYREMLEATEGYTPWRRVDECLKPGEQIVKGKRGKWVTWRVVSATRWTA